MPNAYISLETFKAELRMPEDAFRDDVVMGVIEDVSRSFEEMRGTRGQWHWYPEIAIRDFDGRGTDRLLLPTWLVSVTAVTVDEDGDGVYELTLVEDTDYWLMPSNVGPKRELIINPESAILSSWPWGRRRVRVAGTFGWSEDSETVLAKKGGAAVLLNGAIADAITTSVTLDGGHSVSVGDTILVDTEQMYVRVVEAAVLTVTRGENGTTAATHSDDAPVSRIRYARGLSRATLMQSARLYRQSQDGFAGGLAQAEIAGFTFTTLFPAIRDALAPYFDPVVA